MSESDGKPSRASLLESVLGAAPFRLDILTADGQQVYSNHDRPAASGRYDVRRFTVAAGHHEFSIVLAVEDEDGDAERQELIRRAYFDDVTGLPNRIVAERSVGALIAEGQVEFALALIGLDSFGAIHDVFGHESSDSLLAKLAQRMSGELRDTDLLARLCGDEFLLLLAPIASADEARSRIGVLLDRIRQPLVVDGHEVFASATAGVSLYPEHGKDYTTLQVNANNAMIDARAESRGSISIFDASMQQVALARSRTEHRLREAILDRRIVCAYQPKVALASGDVRGVEVLMRWFDEDGTLQPPGDFVKVAGEIGLIDQLTHMILAETIESLDLINEAFGDDISISINIAARQAGNQRFMETIVERLRETGQASRFMIEITEDAFMATSEFQRTILPMLRAIGTGVSIDDFGTGYSSLSALTDIIADEIKIDRSFITEVHKRPRSQSVLKAIEALGHSLGMSITAEGVETVEELTYLQRMTAIQLGQGHYFAKAMLLGDRTSARGETSRRPAVTRMVPTSRT